MRIKKKLKVKFKQVVKDSKSEFTQSGKVIKDSFNNVKGSNNGCLIVEYNSSLAELYKRKIEILENYLFLENKKLQYYKLVYNEIQNKC